MNQKTQKLYLEKHKLQIESDLLVSEGARLLVQKDELNKSMQVISLRIKKIQDKKQEIADHCQQVEELEAQLPKSPDEKNEK